MHRMRSLLRAAVVCSSLTLFIGCVWFAHKQANPPIMPSSKLLVLPQPNQTTPQAVMPGSKSGTLIMSGSKSYTGGTTISSGALQTGKPLLPPVP